MNIIFIAPSAYLLGGVQDWLYSTVLGLRDRGHNVQVGVPDGMFHSGKIYNKEFKGLDADLFSNKSGTNEGRINTLEKFLLRKKPDLVVGVNIGNLYEAVSRLKRKHNLRFAMTVHALEANYFEDIRMYKGLIDGLITTNKLTMQMAKEIGELEDERVYYAPYGVPIEMTRPKRNIETEKVNIIWVGRLDQAQKRVMDLIEIVGYLDEMHVDYQLSIAGEGPQRYQVEKGLEKQVAKQKVRFCGKLNKNSLYSLYKDNDILLITSEWETGPIVAWEAISAGCTVVSSRYTGCKAEQTLVDQETALLFNISDTKDAALKILKLRDKGTREIIQSKSRQLVQERYSSKASLDAWELAFQQILGSTRQPKAEGIDEACVNPPNSGRLEKMIGLRGSELIRSLLPKNKPKDAGCEWPHSLQGIYDQTKILNYARQIEDAC
jgi:glycosyltransferase involved in cell wall biosynthesis